MPKQHRKKGKNTAGTELIEVTIKKQETDTSDWIRILTGVLASVSVLGILLTSFQWGFGIKIYHLLALGVITCSLLLLIQSHRSAAAVNLLLPAGIIGSILYARKLFLNGMTVLINDIISTVNTADSRIWHEFMVTGTARDQEMGLKMALIMIVLLISCILAWVIRYTDVAVFTAIEGILLGSVLYFSCRINMVFVVTGCAAWSALWVMSASRQVSRARPILLAMAVCTICMSLLLLAVKPWYDYKSPAVARIEDRLVSGVRHMRYGSDALPEGMLSKGIDRQNKEKTRIRVTVSGMQPDYGISQPLYFKGYTGAVYEADRFGALDRKAYTGSYLGMFDYLESLDCLPQYQVGRYLELDAAKHCGETKAGKQLKITIENTGANRKYFYAPAGITMGTDSLLNGNTAYDTMLFTGGLRGQTQYSYEAWAPDNPVLYEAAAHTGELQTGAVGAAYETFALGERAYRKFVYDSYLQLPEGLEAKADSAALSRLGGETIEEVTQSIRDYLDTCAKYDADAKWTLDGRDFFAAFLKDEQKGDAMHFAAAGTLLFRLCHVPARYVEGYYLGEELLETGAAVYELTDENAHAWIEIYLDGIGFIPVEVTPGFYQDGNKRPLPVQKQVTEVSGNAKPEAPNTNSGHRVISPTGDMLWISGILSAIVILLLLIRRNVLHLIWKRELAAKDSEEAVSAACRYMEAMLGGIGITADFTEADELTEQLEGRLGLGIAEPYQQSISIIRKIRFSQASLTIEERGIIMAFLARLKKAVWKCASRRQKIRLVVWRGL